MLFEKHTIRRAIAPTFALMLGLTACSQESSKSEPKPIVPKETEVTTVGIAEDIQITDIYTPTGKRITLYDNSDGTADSYTARLGYCDGPDLAEQTILNVISNRSDAGGAGNSITRTPRHPACEDDGKLTESDFRLPG